MTNSDLRSYLAELERVGELLRIRREVDPELEIAAIADRVSRAGEEANKALLFENVSESRFPVLINALSSRRRMLMTCGVSEWADLESLLGDFIEKSSHRWSQHSTNISHANNGLGNFQSKIK